MKFDRYSNADLQHVEVGGELSRRKYNAWERELISRDYHETAKANHEERRKRGNEDL